jgi:hypothetical protein
VAQAEGGVIFLAVTASICAAALAVLFWMMWCDMDFITSAVLAFALFPVLVLAMMAWRTVL